jgi:RNA polymerase sigma factor (sigma-70 family)
MVPSRSGLILQHFRDLVAKTEGDTSDRELLQRFARQRDEAAFATLVRRHGPMVLQVCRRTLQHWHDAEEVCQAVFLVLASKASSRGWHASIANWLHQVAYHLALNARTTAVRRARHESRASAPPSPDPIAEITGRELKAVLDEELARLPAKYRTPLILCYLEGATRDEAARMLGWPLSTLKSRVERGRELLGRRLAARGLTLSAGLSTALLLESPSQAALPAGIAASIVQTAVSFATGKTSAAGAATQSAVGLARVMLKTMFLGHLKVAGVCLLTVGLLTLGVGLATYPTASTEPRAAQSDDDARSPIPDNQKRAGAGEQNRVDQYGDRLPSVAVARLGTLRFRHGNHITSIAWTPDGNLLSNGWDCLRLWDVRTGKELPRFPQETPFAFAALSPDGKCVATAEANDGVSVWDFASGRRLRTFGQRQFGRLQFSPDGKLLLGFHSHPKTFLWEVATGRQVHVWDSQTQSGPVYSATFSPDGKAVIVGDDKVIRFWDVDSGRQRREIPVPSAIGALATSPDGTMLATIGQIRHRLGGGAFNDIPDSFIRLWTISTGQEVRRLLGPAEIRTGFAPPISFSPDGKMLIAGWADQANPAVCAWDLATGKALPPIKLDAPCYSSLVFAPDRKTVATSIGGSTIGLIDMASGRVLPPPGGHHQWVGPIVFFPNGRTIATASGKVIRIWDSATGRERLPLQGHEGSIVSLVLGTDGRTLLSTSRDNTLRAWELASGKELQRWSLDLGPLLQLLAVSHEGKMAALTGDSASVIIIDLATGAKKQVLTRQGWRINGAAFSRDSQTVVIWTAEQTLHWWDVATGKMLRQYPDPIPPAPNFGGLRQSTTWAVSADGQFIAFSGNHFIVVQELATGKEVRKVMELPDHVVRLAFSTDGRVLAWSGLSGRVRLLEVATGKERHEFVGHRGGIWVLTFSADGSLLASGSHDTTALVWDLTGRLGAAPGWGRRPSDQELSAHWAELAGDDAAGAFRAIQELAASPAEAVPYLAKRLHPVPVADAQRVDQLLADLGSPQFAVRQKATKGLDDLGEAAMGAYQRALDARPALEVRQRLEALLDKRLEERRHPSPDHLRTLRALEALERCGTPEARQVFETLAQGASGASLSLDAQAALARLAKLSVSASSGK